MFDSRKLSASKVSAGILRGIFIIAEYTGMVFFSVRKDHVVAIKRSWWREWLSLILRIIPVGFYIYTYLMWIMYREIRMEQVLHSIRLLLSVPCYLAMIYIQLFHCPKVIKLINQYVRIFRQVRSLATKERFGFGGGRELFLILLSLACQLQEIFFLMGLLCWVINLESIIGWASYFFVIVSSNMILRINFFWYLSLGILYKELNEYLRSETGAQFDVLKHQQRYQPVYKQLRQIRKLKKALSIFREIYYVVSCLQNITNTHLFVSLSHTLLYLIVVSYKMIIDLNFSQFWLWFLFVKIMIDVLIVTLAIQGAVNQFEYIRGVLLEIFFMSELRDWKKTVELFVFHLNLYKLRVRFLGLFDVSNKLFLVIVSGMICYLVFIVQYVIQLQNI